MTIADGGVEELRGADRVTTEREVAAYLSGPAALRGFPPGASDDPAEAAAYLAQGRSTAYPTNGAERCPVARLAEVEVAPGVPARVYVPAGEGPFPVLVYYHGGGWVLGDLDMHDLTCRKLATAGRLCVVNAGYRLAPEHPYPVPLDDCFAALRWAHENAAAYSGDPSRLVVAGSSAGGNLAAGVALRAREEGPDLALQVLICPVIDSEMSTASYMEFSSGHFLSAEQMGWYWDQYLPAPADRRNPRVSPRHAESLAGLPPAIVVTAGRDPLRDEGEQYAARLAAEASGAQTIRVPGQLHGFLGLLDVFSDAEPILLEVASRIRTTVS